MTKNIFNFKTTAEIKVPESLIDQIIGQDEAVTIVKKAAKQRRNVLLIGTPGTGKSLLGQALAKLLGKEKLIDVLAYPNLQDENVPLVKIVPKGKGRDLVAKARIQATTSFKNQSTIILIIVLISSIIPYLLWKSGKISDIIYAASMITSIIFIIGLILFLNLGRRMKSSSIAIPKLLLDNSEKNNAPYIEATGSHSGSLLGDCLHDPLQTFVPDMKITKINESHNLKLLQQIEFDKLLNPLFEKNKNRLIKKGKYEAFFTEKNELFVMGNQDNLIKETEVLSSNRYHFNGNLIKIVTVQGKVLTVTPEHRIAIKTLGSLKYIRADKLKPKHKLIIFE